VKGIERTQCGYCNRGSLASLINVAKRRVSRCSATLKDEKALVGLDAGDGWTAVTKMLNKFIMRLAQGCSVRYAGAGANVRSRHYLATVLRITLTLVATSL
jgi:hypothetical protein